MRNLFKLLGIISLALIIGFSMVACSSDSGSSTPPGGGGSPLVGEWEGDDGSVTFKSDGTIEVSENLKGTYTTSGNSIVITVTQVYANGRWYTKAEAEAESSFPPAQVEEAFATMTVTYTLNGNTLTIVMGDGEDVETMTFTKKAGSSGPGGGGGPGLTFTGEVPDAIQAEIDANIAAGIEYIYNISAILSANTLPANAAALEDLIYNADWDEGTKLATLESKIADIKANNKTVLETKTGDTYTGSGAHLLYIKFDTSGNKTWCAVVTFTSGSGSIAWSALVNANNLGSAGPGPGGTLTNEAAVTVTDTALIGTWTGDVENGTLVITDTKIGSNDAITIKAGAIAYVLKSTISSGYVTLKAVGGNISMDYGAGSPEPTYTYTISDSTLTIGYTAADRADEIAFAGTKQ